MKIINSIKFLFFTVVFVIPSISWSQYEISESDWNSVNSRVYLVTSNSNNPGYSQYRSLDANKLYLANCGNWEYYLRPNLRKFVSDANSLSPSMDQNMNKLVAIAIKLSESDESNLQKYKNEFSSQLSVCTKSINRFYSPIVSIHSSLVSFSDVNTGYDYSYQAKYENQNINPSISETANAIARIRGTTEALKADLLSLINILKGLENSDPILVDLTTESARKSWQNIKNGLVEFGSKAGGEGWDINYVEHSKGSFTQLDDVRWREDNTNYKFREYARDVWSVYLYDQGRNVYLRLDQWTKKVHYRSGNNGEYSVLYSITNTRSKMNGKLLEGVAYMNNGRPERQIVKIGNKWYEGNINSTSNRNMFIETGRDDWSVYLWDQSRNVRLGLDMHRLMVTYSDANTPKRDQYKLAYGY